jgi:photosystem II stability/assembly factor-like uncharacterized protein
MGIFIDGKKLRKPFYNNRRLNAYTNGHKIWKYYKITEINYPDYISYCNNMFITHSGSPLYVYYSIDGINWLKANNNIGSSANYCIYGNGVYLISQNNITHYSTDCINWTKQNLPYSYSWKLAFGNGLFVGVGNYGTSNIAQFAYSTDGKNWTGNLKNDITNDLSCVIYGNNKFVALGNQILLYSTNGISWTKKNLNYSYNTVIYANNMFVAFGNNYKAYSTDGINWTESEISEGVSSVTFGKGMFVALGNQILLYSTNGISWTKKKLNYNYSSVAFGNNKFIAFGWISAVYAYSDNGIDWTESI